MKKPVIKSVIGQYMIRILKGNQEITSLNGKQITIAIPMNSRF